MIQTRALFRVGVVLLACGALSAQAGHGGRSTGGAVGLQQAVEDAGNDWLVLLVAAHPDDDYLLAAARLRFDYGFRVAVLLATRGEGGQNSEGPETGDALGRIRTLEAEASAAELGIQVWYLNRPDGGYCRTAAEALSLWGREGTVADMARLIRQIRPDIVLTTHHPAESHGNDLALVDMLPEAVERASEPGSVAGDPMRGPRLFMGVAPGAGRDLDAAIELEMDIMDTTRGATYRRLAYRALVGSHRSQQPFRSMAELYPPSLLFVPVELHGRPPGPALYEGLPTLWNSLPEELTDGTSRRQLVQDLDVELKSYLGTSLLVDKALSIYQTLDSVQRMPGSELDVRLRRRLEALRRVIQYGCALQVEVDSGRAVAVPGERLPLRVTIHNGETKTIEELWIESVDGGVLDTGSSTPARRFTLPTRESLEIGCSYQVPASWSRVDSPAATLYSGDGFRWPVQLVVHYRVGALEFSTPVDVPVEVRPAVEIFSTPRRLLVPVGLRILKFSVQVRRNSDSPVVGDLLVEGPAGFVVRNESGNLSSVSVNLDGALRGQTYDFELTVPDALPAGINVLRFRLNDEVVAEVKIHKVRVNIDPELRVGLIRGVEKSTEEALRGLGVYLTLLTDEAVMSGDLGEFDTIVLDLRALRARARARDAFGRLLRFANGGGRLLVFYHKDTEFNLESAGFRGYPYEPFHIGRGRVTRADAPVTILNATHPLMTRPNRIGAVDWDGWVQERGLYFPDQFGEEYEPLLEMADPGQPVERSSLLYAKYGRGEFIYCALSLYRQLKNMHPGAVRLFANMLTPE